MSGAVGTFNSNEHHLMMAQYAARLAKENKPSNGADPTIQQQTLDTTQKSQRELITQLESKNKEIMREIQKLR